MNHPPRCWTNPGHEHCAIRAAIDITENRAVWLRGNLNNPTPEATQTALTILGEGPERRQWNPGSRVLTPQQIQQIRDLHGTGPTMRQLGERYGVSRQLILRIVHAAEAA